MTIFPTHRRRGEEICPDCFSSLKWVYDGVSWIPCDTEPVYFYPGEGRETVVYRRETIKNALLYCAGMEVDSTPLMGLRPHFYTCKPIPKE